MSSFTPTSKRLACDICGDTSGKCRVHKGGEILLCMPFSNARFGEIQNGYKCIKEDKGKGWSTWKIDNTQEWTQQQRQEWKQRLEARRRQQAKLDEARASRALSERQKHEQYQKMLAELTLHPEDRADLVRRGFTNEQIELSGFKSVENWQKLLGEYSSLLPGMGIGGKRLLTGKGYLCPIRNVQGLTVALQVRLRKIKNGEGRYRWLSSVTKKNPTGQSPHIYHKGFDPELPLAIHLPKKLSKLAIGICEGIGSKPFLASQRLGIPFIGAAGGQHTSSPNIFLSSIQQIEATLWQIVQENGSSSINQPHPRNQKESQSSVNKGNQSKTEQKYQPQSLNIGTERSHSVTKAQSSYSTLNSSQWLKKNLSGSLAATLSSTDSKCSPSEILRFQLAASQFPSQIEIFFTPDAGSPSNKNVVAQYLRAAELLIEWGYTPVFAWWGQFTKNDPDIDELSVERYSEIEYLSVEEFKALAIEHGGYQEREDQAQKYLKPIPELPTVGFHSSRTTMQELKRVFGELNSETGKEWLQLRKFTPDHTINQKYFDWESPKSGEGLAVKSGLGTGKSWWANQKYLANPDDGAAIGGYRNVLLEQFCSNGHELNGRHWNQIQGDLKANGELVLLADPQSRIAGAVDSWGYFSPHHFEAKKIIFDEVESVAKHLHHSNTAVSLYRETIKQRVIDGLLLGDSFFLSDANLTDFTVEYFEKLSSRKITKVQNTYTGNRGKIYLYDGSSRRRKATEADVTNGLASKIGEWMEFDVKTDDCSKLHKIMMELPPDIPIIISADSQAKCEAWDSLLSKKGRKVFRLDSTTSNTEEGRDFLRDPKEFILSHGINTVILSPSAESGVSIVMPGFFKYEFLFFFGVSATDTQVQFTGRNRDPETTRFVFCQQHSNLHKKIGFSNLTSSGLHQAYIDYTLDCAKISLSGLSEVERQNKILDLALDLVKRSVDPHYEYECRVIAKDNFERKHPRLCLEYALRDSGWDVVTVRGREDDASELREQQEQIQITEAKATHSVETLSPTEADKLSRKLDKTPDERRQVAKSRLLSRLPGFENKTIQEEHKISPEEVYSVVGNHKIVEIDGVSSSEDGFAEKQKVLQQLAVQQQTQAGKNSQQQATDDSTEEIRCDNTLKNGGVSQPESLTTEGFEPVPPPADNSYKTREGVSQLLSVTFEKPVFDPEFIHTVKNKDRNLISRVESQFLLKNPEAVKLLQQQRWHKKLSIFTDPSEPDCKKKIHLATYRSKLLQVQTLLDMGIGWFLNLGISWHKESPELVKFWEKGKDPLYCRNVGVDASKFTPCDYLGMILKKFNLSTKCNRSRVNGEIVRNYSLKPSKPLHQAIFESVAERISTKISEFVFDWKKVVEGTLLSHAQNQQISTAEIQVTKEVEPVTPPADNSYKTREGVSHPPRSTDIAEPLQPALNLEGLDRSPVTEEQLKVLRTIASESPENKSKLKEWVFLEFFLEKIDQLSQWQYWQIIDDFAFASF